MSRGDVVRKWFFVSNGFGLLCAAFALANLIRVEHGLDHMMLWPAGLLLLHGLLVPVFLRARRGVRWAGAGGRELLRRHSS